MRPCCRASCSSAPNSAFIENIGSERDVVLVSPAFPVSSATAKLTFWNHYFVEDGWDGGVLEIKVGAADWTGEPARSWVRALL